MQIQPIYDFKKAEEEILSFWENRGIYEKVKAAARERAVAAGRKPFYFLQGPPYTSGRLHIGHAWNNSLKDIILRFKRACGFDVWDRAGYDMHGLPTENAVQKKLGLKTKEDIEKYGIDRFIRECIAFSTENAQLMNKDLWRLGVWLDYKNAYLPIKNQFMEGEWWLIKKAWEKKRLYKGIKVMTWCASCETSLAKHELEYETIKDSSYFIKLRLVGKPKEFLIIWTTTPWTIPFNLAVMVNPDIEYVRAKVGDEVWIVAKALVGAFVQGLLGKSFEVVETVKGEQLEGLKYQHPFYEEIPYFKELEEAKAGKALHTIVLSTEYVDVGAGTGLVHCAPGCGPEDFEIGQRNNLPPFNRIDEKGVFHQMGRFDGLVARKDDKLFVEALKEKGAIVAESPIEHEYPHCWRCHNPVVFRPTEQWFLHIEDLKNALLRANNEVRWIPPRFKELFEKWILSLKDNSITRQRYWGTPVPIWECNSCAAISVIGSISELRERATDELPKDLHRPWIDGVLLKCNHCNSLMKRIPDVIDVWIDAGTTSWNSLDYPANVQLFERLFPADLIIEASEQVRLWFSMLQICSLVGLERSCYNNVYVHGMILDWQGMKMSKSLGNIISPYEVVERLGVDVLRYYMCSTPAGENINFKWEEAKQKQRNLTVLWNISNWLLGLAKELGENPSKFDEKKLSELEKRRGIEEKYILSKLNSTIGTVTELLEGYEIDRAIEPLERLFLELSRTYIQLVRDKAAIGEAEERSLVLWTVYKVLIECLKMFAIVAPFISEKIYQNIKQAFLLNIESIHLFEWPKCDDRLVDEKLEERIAAAQSLISAIMAAREKAGLGIRWPVSEVAIVTDNRRLIDTVKELTELVKTQTNVKEIKISKIQPTTERYVKVEMKDGKVFLNKELTPELEAEGFARELIRKIQAMRKKAGLEKSNRIELSVATDAKAVEMLRDWKDKISAKVGAEKFEITTVKPKKEFSQMSKERIKDKEILIAFDVLR